MQAVMGEHLPCQGMTFVNGTSDISYLESVTFLWGVSTWEFSKVISMHKHMYVI
jgi:hypothetical protein